MKIELTNKQKEELELMHRKARDRRVADRIKAVLLNAEGWTQKQIAQALRIRYETVQDHRNDSLHNDNASKSLALPQTRFSSLVPFADFHFFLVRI